MFDFLLRYTFRDRKWHMANIIYHRCQKKGDQFFAGFNDTWIQISLSTRDKSTANVTSNQWLFTAGNNDTGRQFTGPCNVQANFWWKSNCRQRDYKGPEGNWFRKITKVEYFTWHRLFKRSPKSRFIKGWVHRKNRICVNCVPVLLDCRELSYLLLYYDIQNTKKTTLSFLLGFLFSV